MGGRPVAGQLDQVVPRFAVKEARPYHPIGRIQLAPFRKGAFRILGESGYISTSRTPNSGWSICACRPGRRSACNSTATAIAGWPSFGGLKKGREVAAPNLETLFKIIVRGTGSDDKGRCVSLR